MNMSINKRVLSTVWITILLLICGTQSPIYAQDKVANPHQEDEKAIRNAIYEIGLATLTEDARMYRKNSSQRTVDLYKLVFDELCKNEEMREDLRKNGITSGDEMMEATASHSMQGKTGIQRTHAETVAHEAADMATITFLNDTEAKIENRGVEVRAVLENKDWKIDTTEILKARFLESNLPLNQESKDKIKGY
jgi:hypothetical protein